MEREVLGVGSIPVAILRIPVAILRIPVAILRIPVAILRIPVAILPSCQYMKMLHHNCIDMNIVG